jgi:NAD-dependent deacetylase
MDDNTRASLERAAAIVKKSRSLIAFTGAGVSRESGVPTFRGSGGLWERIDPGALEISRFRADPEGSWKVIRELFYGDGGGATGRPEPNAAHRVLAEWEAAGLLTFLVTQNIDGLHRAAGSRRVAEFHGSVSELVCQRCGARVSAGSEALAAGLLAELPPRCKAAGSGGRACGGILKPDFVFFGESIPHAAYESAFDAASNADACIIIGSTGVVYPAAEVPLVVARSGGKLIEIDPGETEFSGMAAARIRLGAVEAMCELDALVRGSSR